MKYFFNKKILIKPYKNRVLFRNLIEGLRYFSIEKYRLKNNKYKRYICKRKEYYSFLTPNTKTLVGIDFKSISISGFVIKIRE